MSGRRFAPFTDEELKGIAIAFDAASSEGAFGSDSDVVLARELGAELKVRGLLVELPYGGRKVAPNVWLRPMEDK